MQNLSLFVAHYSFMTTLLSMNMYERKQNQKLDKKNIDRILLWLVVALGGGGGNSNEINIRRLLSVQKFSYRLSKYSLLLFHL